MIPFNMLMIGKVKWNTELTSRDETKKWFEVNLATVEELTSGINSSLTY